MLHRNHQPKLTHRTQSGFTMVELSITLAFLALLLISIAVITTNIIAIYQKGMTLKAVNSVGRGLVEELTTAINTAPSVDTTSLCNSLAGNDAAACRSDNASKPTTTPPASNTTVSSAPAIIPTSGTPTTA